MTAVHRSGDDIMEKWHSIAHWDVCMTLTKKQQSDHMMTQYDTDHMMTHDDTDHMMTQGAAQQRGKHMGITAAPPFSPDSSLDFMPFSRA